jgi:hypothetical protein
LALNVPAPHGTHAAAAAEMPYVPGSQAEQAAAAPGANAPMGHGVTVTDVSVSGQA